MTTLPLATASPQKPRKRVRLAIDRRLRRLMYVVLAILAVLFANSAYLASITFLEWATGHAYQNYMYQYMFLAHLVLGLLLIVPFLVFALIHMRNTWTRRNRRAVYVGYGLFAVSIVLLISGVLLVRVGGFDLRQPLARNLAYWAHVITPLLAMWLYWLHRLAGPRIRYRYGFGYLVGVVGLVLILAGMHSQDPRTWQVSGPKEGEKYFAPSLAKTATGKFIPAETLMMDDYCARCHPDAHANWSQSAHRFSSFNNPAYLASVRETREVSLLRDGSVRASRWCAGCHDPVPFFSGAFDDPNYDDVEDVTAHAGVTCTVCHSITHVDSSRGNADYTIEEPQHYPFARSDNPLLQWLNGQLIKAKPAMHKKTFLKDFHSSAEFCSACHKVHLPYSVTHYKEFLRGQNHYDSWLLSGVSGHGARSFYYPEHAQQNCNGCHMPLTESSDFGAIPNEDGQLAIHDHLFLGANTAVGWWNRSEAAVEAHTEFLKGSLRVDIFGIRENGAIDGTLHAPLGPDLPTLQPGSRYLLETVLRTLKVGHHFTQGTSDSNEVWVEVTVSSGDRDLYTSGSPDERGEVDPEAHFVNTFMLDAEGNRINRRNPQDIVVPLYSNQMPPGAGQVVHYDLYVPEDLDDHVTIEVRLNYRKFDTEYMQIIAEKAKPGDRPIRGIDGKELERNPLPIVTIAEDRITLPVAGIEKPLPPDAGSSGQSIPTWQRWNDYGIGLFLKGKAQLRQAEEAFQRVEDLGRYDGPLNLARVYQVEGRLDEAVEAINRAAAHTEPAPPAWTLSWLSGVVNRQQGHFDAAEENFRSVLFDRTPEQVRRGFDFSRDYIVNNDLGQTLFDQARRIRGSARAEEAEAKRREAVEVFQRTLSLDVENVTAHYNLSLLYGQLGEEKLAEHHRRLHEIYKPDDNAAGVAIGRARQKYPDANRAAEPLVIYPLHSVP